MVTILTRLARTIESRHNANKEKSYVASLLNRGAEKCAEKFGEESIELIIAAVKNDKKNLIEEAADVLFHLLVLLAAREVKIENVLHELRRREGKSGLTVKSERKKKNGYP